MQPPPQDQDEEMPLVQHQEVFGPQTMEGEAVEAGATNSGPPRLAGESRAEKRAAASRREDQGIRLWLDVIGEVLLETPHHGPGDGDSPLGPPKSWAPGPI